MADRVSCDYDLSKTITVEKYVHISLSLDNEK